MNQVSPAPYPDSGRRSTAVTPSVSVLIPVTGRFDDVTSVYAAYRAALDPVAPDAEFIYVLDGPRPEVSAPLEALVEGEHPIRILHLPRPFGEASAISVGFQSCRADLILCLPPYLQTDPSTLPRLFEEIELVDMVVASRDRRHDRFVNRLRAKAFRALTRLCGSEFDDLGSGAWLLRREVARSIQIYGEQHRFLPLLAESRGFRVIQVTLPQHHNDRNIRWSGPFVFVERLLDLMTMFFLLRFTRRPFRFFGTLGLGIGALGLLTGGLVSLQKFAYGTPLADRPALVLSVLLLVLGVQITAVGLIGEIVVFTRSKDSDDFLVGAITRADPDGIMTE